MEQVTTSEIWDYHPGHVRIFVVRGDLDAYLSTDLCDRLERALTETPNVLFVDLEDVTFMDASAVAVLVAASKKARASGAVLRLVAPSDPAERLLRLTHTEDVLPVETDLISALV
jgi:anti-sigma B factor antagonist